MTTSENREKQSVLVSGDNMHGKHHCEVLIMNRDADGPGGAGNYYNSLGVVDDVPDSVGRGGLEDPAAHPLRQVVAQLRAT